jgi:cellulose biosynthesis protein BcsQ
LLFLPKDGLVLYPIRTDIRLAEAMAAEQPIRQYAPKSLRAQDFAELAQEVINRLEVK